MLVFGLKLIIKLIVNKELGNGLYGREVCGWLLFKGLVIL